jgi:hypothetical protein
MHQEYHPAQQDGPLMMCLIMKRILGISEVSIQALISCVTAMKLSKMQEEDMEEAVGMIKSTIKMLNQCSTNERNFVPDDIEVLVLKVFQTALLDEFNEIFRHAERDARARANKYGGIVHYLYVQEMCQLASNAFKQLTDPGEEYKWVSKPKQGGHVTQTSVSPSTRKCFNCGKPGCIPSTCNQPHDDEKIKRNAEAWKKNHPPKSGTANGGTVQKRCEGPGGCRGGGSNKDKDNTAKF